MEVTTKELRIRPRKIIDYARNGEEITVTFRGKALVKIIPIKNDSTKSDESDNTLFGLWKDHDTINDVEKQVRNIRKGRQF